MTRDVAIGVIGLAGSVLLLVMAQGLPTPALVPIGPGFYPRILFGVTAALSVLLIVSGLRQREQQERPATSYRLVLSTFAVVIAYLLVLPLLGYRLGTFLFVAVLQAVLERPRTTARWALLVAIALVTSIATYYVFEVYLSVLLPRGRLTEF
jgi:hypothetical protein